MSAGRAIAGHIGAQARFEYTVIGDPVNEAARLTELAKLEEGHVLASAIAVSGALDAEALCWDVGEIVELRGRIRADPAGPPAEPGVARRSRPMASARSGRRTKLYGRRAAALSRLLGGAFFAGAFLAAFFVLLTGPRARRSASSSAARSSVIDSTSSPLRRLALVSPSVTYGPNRPSLITIGLPRRRVVAQLAQRRRRSALPATAFGLGVDLQRLVERDVEHLLFGGQRARVGAALQVWAVAAVLRGDLLAVGRVDADDPRQRQQPQRVLERDRLQVHRPQQRAGARLGPGRLLALLGRRASSLGLLGRLGQHLGDVRPVAAVLGDDLVAGLRVDAERAALLRCGESLFGQLEGQLVRGQLVVEVGPLRLELTVVVRIGTMRSRYGPFGRPAR